MNWRQRVRLVAALVLLVALAGPVSEAQAAEGSPSALGRVWDWLAAVLPWGFPAGAGVDQCSAINRKGRWPGEPTAVTSDQCSHMDPNGQCRDATASGPSGQGLSIDPDG